jgi:hypothetical protein
VELLKDLKLAVETGALAEFDAAVVSLLQIPELCLISNLYNSHRY